MKGFNRQNKLLSLCGLNCGLCPMFLNKNCPGCGGGEGNQSCRIARCSMERGGVEYCCQCNEYPCEKYEQIDDFDSFITHRNRRADLEKIRQLGAEAYNTEQMKKIKILNPRRVHSPMLASQQTNDERSESRADTPQLAAGSFMCARRAHVLTGESPESRQTSAPTHRNHFRLLQEDKAA